MRRPADREPTERERAEHRAMAEAIRRAAERDREQTGGPMDPEAEFRAEFERGWLKPLRDASRAHKPAGNRGRERPAGGRE